MENTEDLIADLFAIALEDGCTAETATARVLDLMPAALGGHWHPQRVRLPEDMARQLLAYVEAIDATASKWWRWARQGRAAPLPHPFPPRKEALSLATALHSGRRIKIGSVLQVYLLWKKATELPCYRAGDPSFLVGWRQPKPRDLGWPQLKPQDADKTKPRRPAVDVDWADYVFTWNDFKDEPEEGTD